MDLNPFYLALFAFVFPYQALYLVYMKPQRPIIQDKVI